MEAALNGPTGRISLGPGPLTIGRMPGSQLLLTDPQSSGHHAEIRPEGQGYSIIDLGSTNGTFVNEQRLTPHVSRMLVSGDRMRIGGTVFSYEAKEPEPFAPTVYGGSPGQGNTPAFEPTVAVPPPVNYGSNAQRGYPHTPPAGYQRPPAYQGYAVPQPQYAPPGAPGYSPGGATKKKGRGLWIVLSIIAILLIVVVAFTAYAYANRSTPTRTLTTFCNDLKSGNYHDAYQQLSSGAQSQQSEANFTTSLQRSFASAGGLKDCTFNNESDAGSTATAVMTLTVNLSVIPPINYNANLVNESGSWKINQVKKQQ
jgi:FHA domain/NTF2-like N-terminal transpeptidase domain